MTYADAHADMASATRRGCHTTSAEDSDTFNFGKQGGVTNGAAWYSLKGGKWQVYSKLWFNLAAYVA